MAKAQIIETKKTKSGAVIRLQRRAGKFDVTKNSTGYTVRYVAKGVSEAEARNTFFMESL